MTEQSVIIRADDETVIRDDDLQAQLARATRNSFYPALLSNLVDQQRQRDAERSRKGQLTAVARRREDVRDLIQSNPLSEADRQGYAIDKKYLTDKIESLLGSKEKLLASKIFPDPSVPPDPRPLQSSDPR